MNSTVFDLEIANARHSDLIEQARRQGMAKRARRVVNNCAEKVHKVNVGSRSGERSMT